MTDHPITPSTELVKQWLSTYFSTTITGEVSDVELTLATQASRWGADQELEACCDFLQELHAPSEWITGLRTARRPKPPSLKERALSELDALENMGTCNSDTIRRALEQLDD